MRRQEITHQQRRWIWKRDNDTCQLCGKVKGKNLHVHHVVPFSFAYFLGWSIKRINSPYNLVLICHGCHGKIHNQEPWDLEVENILAEKALENTLNWMRKKGTDKRW